MLSSVKCKICGETTEQHGYRHRDWLRNHLAKNHPIDFAAAMQLESDLLEMRRRIIDKYGNILF